MCLRRVSFHHRAHDWQAECWTLREGFLRCMKSLYIVRGEKNAFGPAFGLPFDCQDQYRYDTIMTSVASSSCMQSRLKPSNLQEQGRAPVRGDSGPVVLSRGIPADTRTGGGASCKDGWRAGAGRSRQGGSTGFLAPAALPLVIAGAHSEAVEAATLQPLHLPMPHSMQAVRSSAVGRAVPLAWLWQVAFPSCEKLQNL